MIQFDIEDDRALFEEAFHFAQRQVKRLIEAHPDFCPMYTRGGKWKHDGPVWTRWCDGFLPGMMWLFHKHSEPFFRWIHGRPLRNRPGTQDSFHFQTKIVVQVGGVVFVDNKAGIQNK